jgi:RHS repeat-associated protein
MIVNITSDILFFKSIRILLSSVLILTFATGFGTIVPSVAQQEGSVFHKTYVRESGEPQTVEDEFSVPDPSGEFLLLVQNGEGGERRVSSAVISINGEQVIGPNEFNQQVGFIEKPITLEEDNVIAVEVRGAPGGFIIVNIIQTGENSPPEITSTPETTGTEGVLYEYDVEATDADGDVLTFSLTLFPEGMTIDATTGLITWTPSGTQAGDHDVTVEVSDGRGGTDTQSFTIDVSEAINNPPEITSTAVTTGTEGVLYQYDVEATDADGDVLTFSLTLFPEGMTIDAATGLITWTPSGTQAGDHDVTVEVSDGRGGTDTQSFTIDVSEAINNPPEITSTPETTGTEGVLYEYDVEATDADGDVLTFSLTLFPEGMTIDATTGLITWTPSGTQAGDHDVTVEVSDGRGGTDTQSFTIDVSEAINNPPVITSTPDTTGTEGELYTYDVEAEDADGDVLAFTLTTFPVGMTIDGGTGLIQWTPTSAQVGDNDVAVEVDDGRGGTDTQSFTITVEAAPPVGDYIRPEVDVTVVPPVVNVGELVTITVDATDDVGVVSMALTVNGVPVPLDPSGTATYTSDVAGVFTAVGTALDAAGNEGLDSEDFRFLSPGDATPPMVAITLPEDESKLSMPTDIIGTASDANLTRYTLEYSAKDRNEFIMFATGTSSVIDDVLGTLDPTTMRNGLYDVRLTAEDVSGNTASITRTYQLEGEMKVGNFTISFNDLTIPVAGIPITITRTYDSRNKTKGDFGIGWTLDIKVAELQENRVPGEGWEIYCTTWIFGVCVEWGVQPTETHTVVVSLPGFREQEFDVQTVTSYADPSGLAQGYLTFVAQPGTFSTLEALDNVTYDFLMGGTLYDMSFNVINPNRYRLTMMDGTVLVINQATGVESITEPNGNTITFGPAGIIHSAGKSVTFTRDAQGRITTITDPMANTIQYNYDYYGDLVSVTDQEGYTTRFTYNSAHGLLDIVDPRGIRPARNEYDGEGRLIAIVDANGNRVEFTHNIGTRQEVVTDRLGNVTVYEYDDDGNVVTQTDALGNTTGYTYDARGNKLSETDALGNTTTYTYDAQDNMLSQTDPLGNTTTYTYNSRGQVLTTTDPLGNVTTNTYDGNGNLTSTTDPLGNVTTNTYDAAGNMTSMTDPLGNVTTYTYDAVGNMISQTDPLGNVTTFTYDANGNKLSETMTRTVSSSVETVTTTYVYDGMNRLVQTIDPYGDTTTIEYNAIGKQSAMVDKLGNRTRYEYDARGNLTRLVYPDGMEETYTYDAENRKLTFTDRAGRTTSYTYDVLGRLIETTFPDGAFTQTEYDAVGRVSRVIDERGNATQYTYDAVGRNISVTDALGNTTLYEYDGNGNRIGMTNANGNAFEYEYDANNRLIRTTFPDGTTASIAYDALGKKISETDQAGNTTQFEYDALGRLIRVTDALGNITSYAYDEVGNMISQTDANGNSTTFEYDNLGRQIRRILPLGMEESTAYGAAGNVISQTDFNGNTITFEYDVNNRLIRKNFSDGTWETYVYTATGQRDTVTDSRGVTSYQYDLRDRLTRRTDPDGTSISYTYDEAGNRISVTIPTGTTNYTYDALNRLSTVTDPDGGVTTYTYDAVGNRVSVTYPNGTVAEYTYDALNRLTNLVNRKSGGEIISSYAYTLGSAGNRIQVVENTGRTVDYTYDATYKLTQESINDPVSGLRVISYTYDPVGNRLTKTDNGVVTNYTYDANDRLLTENGTTYTYDDNGNTLTKVSATENVSYSYDFQNRLIQVTDAVGGSVVGYVYDVDGIRVQKTVDGTDVTNYLVDKNRDYAQVLEERDASNALIVSYIYGDDLISQKRIGGTSYYHYDGLGSTRALTDATEIVLNTYTYEAFGTLIASTVVMPNDYLFTGEQYDPNIGFYYLRARYYMPQQGRFLTMDTWPGSAFDPTSLHKYLYVGNNVINRLDPSGKFGIAGISVSLAISSIIIAIYTTYVISSTIWILSQIPDIAGKTATRYAILLTTLAILELGNNQSYEKWFGVATPVRRNHVTNGYTEIYSALHRDIIFHFTPRNVYAYVIPGGPLEIWLGRLFFSAPMTGIDSKAGTLIHELSHEVHGTADIVYGYSNARILAITSPNDAINNADNYEYFAEETF